MSTREPDRDPLEYGRLSSPEPLLRGRLSESRLVEAVVFDHLEIFGMPKIEDEFDLCFRFGVVSWL